MRSIAIRSLPPLVLASFLLFMSACAGLQPARAAEAKLLVLVAAAVEDSPMLDQAHVFVLGERGGILAEGTTDVLGVVELSVPQGGERPAFVFAEARNFYVGGNRWREGFREYYIKLALGAVR